MSWRNLKTQTRIPYVTLYVYNHCSVTVATVIQSVFLKLFANLSSSSSVPYLRTLFAQSPLMSTVQFVRAVYKCLLRHSSTSIVHLLVRGDSKRGRVRGRRSGPLWSSWCWWYYIIADALLQFLSRVSTLTRDIDIAIMSVRPTVRPSVCLSVRPSVRLSVTFRY